MDHPVSTEMVELYPQTCRFLKLRHHRHSPFEKSIIERTMQYIKDRTESFDDYFPCRLELQTKACEKLDEFIYRLSQ